jgi:hypothetical protein
MLRKAWNWLAIVKAPIGKPWFAVSGILRPVAWQGWFLIIGFGLWIFATGPFVAASDVLGVVWFLFSVSALVVIGWLKTEIRP